MSCLKAASSIFSPSWRSIARRVFPSRLELKSYGGSGGLWLLPFPLLLDVGVGIVDELTDMSEGLSSPIPQLLNPLGDARGGLGIRATGRFHVLSDPAFRQPAPADLFEITRRRT